MHGLSTHVLNTASGLPAAGVLVHCQILKGETWADLQSARTDDDGRVRNFLSGGKLNAGIYRMTFATGAWFAEKNIETFFPTVAIEFRVTDAARHHHVPLLLSPFGYSTYRGS
ncbi:MAG: hydroxyisourate hydrolase [Planctomycetes bacterium]|nr:hydroxyisourate hydrolase [Planctomycetota bacterium]